MQAGFDAAFDELLAHEGGYWDDPAGGPTMWGITERVARDWGYTGEMRKLPQETARAIYRAKYWTPNQCDQLPPILAFQVFDTAVNGGYPIKWMQEAVGAKPDGIIGARTIAAARECDQGKAVLAFNAKRILYMVSLRNFKPNAGGWMTRVAKNMLMGAK
jgi:lysozyme family protein